MKDYKELTVWKTGMEVVGKVYEKLRTYPASEMFALSQQTK
ncbi:MAG: four helix bundle protein [Chitinophagaceae bacterium]|nr:four helix bundle protein [Chitinophagaceae bacterium]